MTASKSPVPDGPASASTVSMDRDATPVGPSAAALGSTVTMDPGAPPVVEPMSVELTLPPRYRDLGVIASGSFGDVRRVHDAELDRTVAMKILRRAVAGESKIQVRFLAEARLMAGLDHPGIVPVHDWGLLGDGRLWFTMREVRGRTLGAVIAEVHSARAAASIPSEWTFRRLVDAFARLCQAVAYAHRRGVVHRDLKPENVMVGELGEVLVMDWGLGKYVPDADSEEAGVTSSTGSPHLTQQGDVLGTPAYMPPEQARGARALHGPPSDVYALGAILYHVLSGRPPYLGTSAWQVLMQVLAGPPAPISETAADRGIPAELAAICDRAMRWEIPERYADAEALSRDVVGWLDGARRREQALALVGRAEAMEPQIAELRAEARRSRLGAQVALDGVAPFDAIDRKRAGWALEDDAARLEVAAALREAEWLETLQGALTIDPELPEAHAALADHASERLLEAERAHRLADAARHEASLRAHDRGRHAALLRGQGALTLVTDPPGAQVLLERYEMEDRRLVPRPAGVLGRTPLQTVPLARGSYRLRISAPGRAEVLYPVEIERGGHWDGCAPGAREPHAIALPEEGALSAEEVYVPAGWCWIGGDAESGDSFPLRRVWVDAFAIHRFPVTNREYLSFLNDLVAVGRGEEAESCCPRAHPSGSEGAGEAAVGRDDGGRYVLRSVAWDASGQTWEPDWPVVLVHWHAAVAFAAWRAARSGHALRLPDELEREKAARGADGRHYPWGNHFDATWACVVDSHPRDTVRAPVQDYPFDESPYGARGLAGNVRDWCANVWTREGPDFTGGRWIRVTADFASDDLRAVRGGAWTSASGLSRSALRFASRPTRRWRTTGLRLARSLHP